MCKSSPSFEDGVPDNPLPDSTSGLPGKYEDPSLRKLPGQLSRRRQGSPMKLWQRIALFALACLQNSLVGGIVFGWASIDRTLLIAPPGEGGAGLTPTETTQIFSWASSVAMLSSLIMGLVLDKGGPRLSSTVSNLFVGTGCWLFSVSHSFNGFAVATCLIAFGGPGISSAIVHIANLFPTNQFLAMSCLCGSVTFSFSVLALFGDLWQAYGWGIHSLFGGYTVVVVASTIGSLSLWPAVPFEKHDSDEYEDFEEERPFMGIPISAEREYVEATISHHQLAEEPLNSGLRKHLAFGRTDSYFQSAQAMNHPEQTEAMELVSLKDQSFWNQISSKLYLRNLVIFVTTSFFVNFTISSISTELADQQLFSLEEQHDLSLCFTLIMSGGVVASILVGCLMDQVGLETCTIITLVLGQASLILQIRWVHSSFVMMLVGFVIYTLFRQFLFPVFIACLTDKLGFKYFGMLSGLGFATSGIAQGFMASLVHRLAGDCHVQSKTDYGTMPCDPGRWSPFHLLQILLLGVLILIPIADRRDAARRDKRMSSFLKKLQFIVDEAPDKAADYGSIEQA